ncbi:MAG: tetratricopeptide repeat protein [Lentisphaeria bacterium]|nr:tetratricopeptide repeat protein [Lentisphaeria bacterium]
MPEEKNGKTSGRVRFLPWTVGLAAVGLVLRAVYLLEFSHSPLFGLALGPDVSEYFQRAREIVAGSFLSREPQIHAPFYSWFLAVAMYGGLAVPGIRVLQLLIGWGSWIGFAGWLHRRTGETRLPLIFLAVAMVYPPVIYFQAELVCESVLLPLLLGAAAALGEAVNGGGRRRWLLTAVGGLLAGCAVITHPTTLLGLLAAGAWLGWMMPGGQRWRQTAVFAGAAALMIAPVIAVRSVQAGRFVPVQHHGGYNLYLGNRIGADGTCNVRPGDGWRDLHAASVRAAEERGISRDDWFLRQAAAFPFQHPLRFGQLTATRAVLLFAPVELPAGADTAMLYEYTRFQRWGSRVAVWLLLAFAVGGIWLIRREDWRIAGPLLLFGAAAALVQLGTVTSGRYRLAVIPAAMLLAALWWSRKGDWKKKLAGGVFGALLPLASLPLIPGWVHDPAEAVSLLAEGYYRNGDPGRAIYLLKDRVADSHDPGRDACLLGSALVAAGYPAEARVWFEYALKRTHDQAAPAMNLALIAAGEGDFAAAERFFAEAAARDPEDADNLYNHGLLLEQLKRPAEAEAKYLAACAAAPAHRQALNALGVLALRNGDPAAAAEWFRRALRLMPEHEGIRRNLAVAERLAAERRHPGKQ